MIDLLTSDPRGMVLAAVAMVAAGALWAVYLAVIEPAVLARRDAQWDAVCDEVERLLAAGKDDGRG